MKINLSEINGAKVLEVHATGKLVHADYAHFVPEFEKFVKEHGKVHVLFNMVDFHGWDIAALWDDIKFDMKHFRDIDRIAMVGDKKWEQWMAAFCKPFTTAEIRYFDAAKRDDARTWLGSKQS
jgi:hypothetical protein